MAWYKGRREPKYYPEQQVSLQPQRQSQSRPPCKLERQATEPESQPQLQPDVNESYIEMDTSRVAHVVHIKDDQSDLSRNPEMLTCVPEIYFPLQNGFDDDKDPYSDDQAEYTFGGDEDEFSTLDTCGNHMQPIKTEVIITHDSESVCSNSSGRLEVDVSQVIFLILSRKLISAQFGTILKNCC